MSKVRADNYANRLGTGAPTFPNGLNVTGIITTSSISVSGNVSIAGTLTYEDVTNVDSIGLITARTGIQVLAGGANIVGILTATSAIVGSAVTVNGNGVNVTGVVTAASFSGSGANLTGLPAGYSDLDNMLFG